MRLPAANSSSIDRSWHDTPRHRACRAPPWPRFHPALSQARRTWLALAVWPACQRRRQRGLRRMPQVFRAGLPQVLGGTPARRGRSLTGQPCPRPRQGRTQPPPSPPPAPRAASVRVQRGPASVPARNAYPKLFPGRSSKRCPSKRGRRAAPSTEKGGRSFACILIWGWLGKFPGASRQGTGQPQARAGFVPAGCFPGRRGGRLRREAAPALRDRPGSPRPARRVAGLGRLRASGRRRRAALLRGRPDRRLASPAPRR